jgi:hypothetical protein
MTVGELIVELQKLPMSKEVAIVCHAYDGTGFVKRIRLPESWDCFRTRGEDIIILDTSEN